ncbi:release factor glutamine methyltransferase isoform X2 [Mangifera indica]|uniref:release factor glutamine methyltransferase isoform X2 n=1 Tax=Mangifera indica TaxID=29780 RepID=UPI001CF9EC09|nr:release factor glutamine methyltransferase isoform X2 [Mangifera indica]
MKVSLLQRYSFPVFRKPSLHYHSAFHTPISFSSSSSSIKPKIPLFLRPPTHSIPLSDLKKWYNWAKNLASSVGSSFLHSDNGADASLLCRELNWLLEDSLEDRSLIPHLGIQESSQNANLRVDLEELYSLWKERIEKRKPLQYLVGCEHWRDLVLCVEEGVFIPRPETELMVDLVSHAIENNEELREGFWVDLGTGSGAIAIGIGRVLGEQGKVFAIDLNPVACSVAALNVQRYGLQDKIEVRRGSWFKTLKDFEGKLSGIVSNPPYIPSDHISGLQAEVGKHEPRLALDGGPDGMEDLLHLLNGAASMLKPGGFFAFEVRWIMIL